MEKNIDEELLDENSSHSVGPQETQELNVDDLRLSVAGTPQNGNNS